MRVKELIQKLQSTDLNAHVYVSEDGEKHEGLLAERVNFFDKVTRTDEKYIIISAD